MIKLSFLNVTINFFFFFFQCGRSRRQLMYKNMIITVYNIKTLCTSFNDRWCSPFLMVRYIRHLPITFPGKILFFFLTLSEENRIYRLLVIYVNVYIYTLRSTIRLSKLCCIYMPMNWPTFLSSILQ